MNYRQWKKKYKKEHGYNPPLSEDKRQQAKAARKATKAVQEWVISLDLFNRAIRCATYAIGQFAFQLGGAFSAAGYELMLRNKESDDI